MRLKWDKKTVIIPLICHRHPDSIPDPLQQVQGQSRSKGLDESQGCLVYALCGY